MKTDGVVEKPKVWLCLYTCCSTRAVHLELVPDLNTLTFIRCFKRFSARRGIPSTVVSDNGKTFTAASRVISDLFKDPSVEEHFSGNQVKWIFNLERSPWWGGFFERMIRSAKRCLKKCIGRASLNFDELSTLVTETEAVLNSRPLTFISMDDMEEPLTPSHLICGYRVLSLPDVVAPEVDEDYCATPEGLSRRARHLQLTLGRFWKRWKREYLLELRDHHRYSRLTGTAENNIHEGAVVTVYDESHPRGLWRLGVVRSLIVGADGVTRGAEVRVHSKTGRPVVLRRPIQHLYPLEVTSQQESEEDCTEEEGKAEVDIREVQQIARRRRPQRVAAMHAKDRMFRFLVD